MPTTEPLPPVDPDGANRYGDVLAAFGHDWLRCTTFAATAPGCAAFRQHCADLTVGLTGGFVAEVRPRVQP